MGVPEVPLIPNIASYNAVLAETTKLAAPILTKANQGEPLDEDDKDQLRKAISGYLACEEFNAVEFPLYFGAGQCLHALGQYADALKQFDQAISYAPTDLQKESKERLSVLASSYVYKSRCLMMLQNPKDSLVAAQQALKIEPSPEHKVDVAAAYIQLKDKPAATKLLNEALKENPTLGSAKQLLRLIKG